MGAIGIMGGTFDPIHFGHLRAAEEVLQGFGLDRIIFLPSGRPPHKSASAKEHRLKMTELAISDHPRFLVSKIEIDREGPSYTLDTLAKIRSEIGQDTPIYFITGLDAILGVCTWHGYKDLFKLANFIAVTRPGYDSHALLGLKSSLGEDCFEKIQLFPVTLLAISSGDIRRYLRQGKSIRYLVPEKVFDYIREERLYIDGNIGRR